MHQGTGNLNRDNFSFLRPPFNHDHSINLGGIPEGTPNGNLIRNTLHQHRHRPPHPRLVSSQGYTLLVKH